MRRVRQWRYGCRGRAPAASRPRSPGVLLLLLLLLLLLPLLLAFARIVILNRSRGPQTSQLAQRPAGVQSTRLAQAG